MAGPNTERILVIDDDPIVNRLCKRVLDREGFAVEIAMSGTQGLRMLDAASFDVVLLDLRLPDWSGLEILSTIQQMDPEMPVIVITGYGTIENAVTALKSGAQDFILKPFEPDELLASIQSVLENGRLRRENLRLATLSPILEISKELISEMNPARLSQRVLETVHRELGADRAALMLLGEASQPPIVLATLGLSDENIANLPDVAEQGSCKAAVQQKRPLLASEWTESEPTQRDSGTVVCVPLVLQDRVLGVLGASRPPELPPFRRDDVGLLSILCDRVAVVLENVRLFEQITQESAERKRAEKMLVQRRQEAEALRDTAAALNSTLDLEEVLDYILDNVGRVVPHDAANIMLVENGTARIVRHRGYGEGRVLTRDFDVALMPTLSQMAVSLLPLAVPSTEGQPDWVTFPEAAPVYSYAGAPICFQGKLVGFLNLNSATPGFFQPVQAKRLQVFADQAAVAIENARLHERLQGYIEQLEQRVMDRTKDLSALYRVTTIASESLDLGTTLERTLDEVAVATNGSAGVVHLLDETEGTLRLVTQRDISPNTISLVSHALTHETLAGWVAEHNEPLVIPDMRTDPRVPSTLRSTRFRAYAGVPMRIERHTIGVLSALSEVEQEFNIEDVALLASIADHMATAVENDRLHRQAERAAVLEERERLARELHDSVTQSLYSLTLLAEAGRELTRTGALEQAAHYQLRVSEIAQHALKEMRLLVHELRPPVLEQEGLVGALRQRLEAVEGRAGVKTRLLADELGDLPAPVEEGLYRIALEALNNALKHAAATSVKVYVRGQDGGIELEVADDGSGFDPDALDGGGGIGLSSMRERAEKLGATLTIRSAPGKGTQVLVRIAEAQTNGEHPNSDRR